MHVSGKVVLPYSGTPTAARQLQVQAQPSYALPMNSDDGIMREIQDTPRGDTILDNGGSTGSLSHLKTTCAI